MLENEITRAEIADWLQDFDVSTSTTARIESSFAVWRIIKSAMALIKNEGAQAFFEQDLLRINSTIADAQILNRQEFLEKHVNHLSAEEIAKGYLEFKLPRQLVTAIKEVIANISQEERAGIDTSISLGRTIRIVYDPNLVSDINKDDSQSKGQFHLFMNVLRGSVFNSGGEVHKSLRSQILKYAKNKGTQAALQENMPLLMSDFLDRVKKGGSFDLVSEVHQWILTFFADEYFPQLQLSAEEAATLRQQPQSVFGAGAASQVLEGLSLFLAEKIVFQPGLESLQKVIAQALLVYANELDAETPGEQKYQPDTWIGEAIVTAYTEGNYRTLFNNILSATAAGTDTTTQVVVDLITKIASNDSGSIKTRERLRKGFAQADPFLAEQLQALAEGRIDVLPEAQWSKFANPANFGSEFADFVTASILESSPVSITFKAKNEKTHEQTYIVPIRLNAEGADKHTAFGESGAGSQCTGRAQATYTTTAIFAHVLFQNWTFSQRKEPSKKIGLMGIVHTHKEFPITLEK